jgi:hypothetical protein
LYPSRGARCLALALSVGALFASAPCVAHAQDAPPEEESTSPVAPPNSARPVWRAQPSRRDVERHYPADSLYDHVTGNAILQCLVRAEDGGLLCVVVSETPEGRGFGEAALKVAQSYRAGPELQDGSPSAGARIRIMVAFGGR